MVSPAQPVTQFSHSHISWWANSLALIEAPPPSMVELPRDAFIVQTQTVQYQSRPTNHPLLRVAFIAAAVAYAADIPNKIFHLSGVVSPFHFADPVSCNNFLTPL